MGQSILLPDNNRPSTPERTLYLVAYDVSDPRRLARVHRFMTGWKVGGQKSFYECWLTASEREVVLRGLRELIEADADRVHLFQLDPRMAPKCFGVASTFRQPFFAIL